MREAMNPAPKTNVKRRERLNYRKLFKDLVERAGIAILIDDRAGNYRVQVGGASARNEAARLGFGMRAE